VVVTDHMILNALVDLVDDSKVASRSEIGQ
jgi:hypothetical protein